VIIGWRAKTARLGIQIPAKARKNETEIGREKTVKRNLWSYLGGVEV
jgi:hypothetical protein